MTRLVVFSHKLFRRTPRGLETTGGFVIQMDALAAHFEQVLLCVPIIDDPDFQGTGITAPNIDFHPLPISTGRLAFLGQILRLRREILAAMKKADLAQVMIPGYIEGLAGFLCRRRNFPMYMWVVGNWGSNVVTRRSNAISRNLARLFVKPLLDWLLTRLTRNTLCFFNGKILYGQSDPLHYTRVSSSIHRDGIHEETDPPPMTPPYKLLFVGRLSGEKGVEYLLRAVALAYEQGLAVELDVVGEGQLASSLARLTEELEIADRVRFLGRIASRTELDQFYRACDIFILPSLQDQQPKVLMEAMAQSTPIIATNVLGIPSIVQDGENGLLVPPADPPAIVEAIRRITDNPQLQQSLIQKGIAHAKEHTVEAETARMMEIITAHFNFDVTRSNPNG